MTPLEVGARLTLQIERLSLGGDGIGKADGAVVFVPYGSPGDTLEVELTEVRRNFSRGRVLRVIEASPIRVEPPCRYHFRTEVRGLRTEEKSKLSPQHSVLSTGLYCGGCSWQHMNYEFQLDAKRQLVQETLERIGGIEDIEVLPTLGMKDPWRYRNKVQQPVGLAPRRPGGGGSTGLITGFYAPFSHDIVPIDECLVQSELSVRIINRARALLEQYQIRPYDESRHNGWIRHFWVRTTSDDKALLVFVTRAPDFPHQSEIIAALIKDFPQLLGIHQNINPGKTNVILGREWRRCAGAEFLEERLGALRFQLSPGSFFQVNTLQTEVLYNQVRNAAGQGKTLLDVYCGVGGIALWLADRFEAVIGVDEVRSAVDDAQKNARLNGIRNARFIAAAAEQFIAKQGGGDAGLTVILDPPRAGCDARVLQALGRLQPGNLIYVSCDPGTLARDLAILGKYGFKTLSAQPVDLFPHTAHIETVVQLKPGHIGGR